jgi:hypothetical protein
MRLVHPLSRQRVPMRLVLLVACLGVAVNRQGPVYANTPPQLEKWRRGAEHVARQLVVESWLAQKSLNFFCDLV